MRALTAAAENDTETSTRLRLLIDCRTAFTDDTALPATVLLERLKADLEAPWTDCGPNGLDPMKLGGSGRWRPSRRGRRTDGAEGG